MQTVLPSLGQQATGCEPRIVPQHNPRSCRTTDFVLYGCAAVDAEAAATAAAEAANKAHAAKQLSGGYAQDAEKWAAAAEIPADAAMPAASQPAQPTVPVAAPPTAPPAAASRPVSGRVSAAPGKAGTASKAPQAAPAAAPAAAATAAATTSSSRGNELGMKPAGGLPAPLAHALHEEWCALEGAYVEGMGKGFAGLRGAHSLAVNQVAANRRWFSALLQQPDDRQALLQEFVTRFNAVELDMRKADETKVSRGFNQC